MRHERQALTTRKKDVTGEQELTLMQIARGPIRSATHICWDGATSSSSSSSSSEEGRNSHYKHSLICSLGGVQVGREEVARGCLGAGGRGAEDARLLQGRAFQKSQMC